MRNKKVSLQDIADHAGVSIATASRVINNKRGVKPVTYEKVMDAITELGYEMDSPAENERDEDGQVIVYLPMEYIEQAGEVMKGIITASRQYGYFTMVNICDSNETVSSSTSLLIREEGALGIIAYGMKNLAFLREVSKMVPVIHCHEFLEHPAYPCITLDNYSSARAATEHLIARGCKNLRLLEVVYRGDHLSPRAKGFLSAIEDTPGCAGSVINLPDFSYDTAMSKLALLFSGEQTPDAILGATDIIASAAIRTAQRSGKNIPGDVSVISFGNSSLASILSPSVTTVVQPKYQLGYCAFEALVNSITNHQPLVSRQIGGYELIVRESSRL